jgi:hypothetical protein
MIRYRMRFGNSISRAPLQRKCVWYTASKRSSVGSRRQSASVIASPVR